MSRSVRDEDPDRFYTLTGGRAPATEDFDLVTLVVSESAPSAGMTSEQVAILDMCRAPTAVVEIAAELRLPVGVATVLLGDLLHAGKIIWNGPLDSLDGCDNAHVRQFITGSAGMAKCSKCSANYWTGRFNGQSECWPTSQKLKTSKTSRM